MKPPQATRVLQARDGVSLGEIASRLMLDPGAVMAHLAQAMAGLATILDEARGATPESADADGSMADEGEVAVAERPCRSRLNS